VFVLRRDDDDDDIDLSVQTDAGDMSEYTSARNVAGTSSLYMSTHDALNPNAHYKMGVEESKWDLAARVGNSATADKDSSGSPTTIYGDVTIVDSETGGDYTKINVNQADGDYTDFTPSSPSYATVSMNQGSGDYTTTTPSSQYSVHSVND